MPAGFEFPDGALDTPDVWLPIQLDPTDPNYIAYDHYLNMMGRLKPGVTVHHAQTELDSLLAEFQRKASIPPSDPSAYRFVTYGLHEEVVRSVRPALRMLFGAVCGLLLIACINVANLLLARAEVRQREFAIRAALGAGAWRLALQFVTEGLVLAFLGTAIGVLLAIAGLQVK